MKLVFTNGCFDILHIGHVKLLEFCHSLAHKSPGGPGKVIVGLNSDESVKRLKGPDRPINNQEDRRYVLESLDYVDMVCMFNEDTPYDIIKKVQPDIIVKGGDFKPEDVVGGDIAEVMIFPYIDGHSTTGILQKL